MHSAKQEVLKVLDSLPDAASLEEIRYRLYLLQKVEAGLRDVEEGRILSQQQAEERMGKWLDG